MKKSSVNTFTEGLVCDLDPINVPNNVLTDCLNGTIITYDDNEYSLQNDKGNYPLKDCKLRENFIPVGIKEHNGILYIASLNPITGEEEIGSYPSPKLYDGWTVNGNINIEYVIDKAFEELKVSELDYSELESRCKSWYYADPKLKLNVGDKFWFDEESSSTNFEKIEKYIIDENSIPHLISNDLMNKSLEYVSPISGTIMLKNKIFEIANSSAETNTFSCWVNDDNNSGKWLSIPNPSDSDISAITSDSVDDSNYQLITTNPSDWSGKYVITFNSLFALNKPQSSENPNIKNLITTGVLIGGDNYAFKIKKHESYYLISNNSGYLWYDEENSELELGKTSIDNECLWSITMNEGKVRISPMLDADYSIRWSGEFDTDVTYGSDNIILYKRKDDSDEDYEDSDTLLNNITSLFSFTHKLYIDDIDTLQWLTNDYLKYKVNLKVNDSIIYSNTFDGNSLISDSKTFGEYEVAIESRYATNLEWYGNNKIISKYFVTVIKNIDSNDQISAEIIPIVSISDTKNIIMSQFAKPLNNSVSEYTSTTWTIGEEYYRFYNYPTDNEYKTQYIELDIKGPIEASDDFSLNYNICEYNSSNCILSGQFTPGIGKTILQIDYNNSFVKEDIYAVEYSIMLAGTSVKSVKKKLITSELFNYNEYVDDYKDYTNIPEDVWVSKYEKTINGGSINMVLDGTTIDLPKSLYTYITGNEDYVNRNIQYPNFIEESSYETYSKFKEARLSGNLYNASVSVTDPTYLTGPLWTVYKTPYIYTDALGKETKSNSSELKLKVPVGTGMYVNFDYTPKVIVGRITDIEEINPITYTYTFTGHVDIKGAGMGSWWIDVSKNSELIKRIDLSPPTYYGKPNNITDITEQIIKDCPFDGDLINIKLILIDGQDSGLSDMITRISAEYKNNNYNQWGTQEIIINNVCKSTKQWFVKIPDTSGKYIKIKSDNNEKYQSGYWCKFHQTKSVINFNNPNVSVLREISVTLKTGYSQQFVWEKNIVDKNISIDKQSSVESEINKINSVCNNDSTEFSKITTQYITTPISGNYVKGIVDSGTKDYSVVSELSTNYRNDDILEIKTSYKNNYIQCDGQLRDAFSQGGVEAHDIVKIYFGSTNGGWL